jgi:hypothetical protein
MATQCTTQPTRKGAGVADGPDPDALVARSRTLRPGELKAGFLRFDHAHLRNEDFSGRRLKIGFRSFESSFTGCKFEKMTIGDAGWGGGRVQSLYTECSFDGTRMGMRAPGNARFVRCSFKGVRIKMMMSLACEFIDCVFTGQVDGAVLRGELLPDDHERYGRARNVIEGNDFSEAELRDVSFRGGVDLTINRLPQGDDYVLVDQSRPVLEHLRERVLQMPPSQLREDALIIIESDLKWATRGQKQLLYHRGDQVKNLADGDAFVFDMLREAVS